MIHRFGPYALAGVVFFMASAYATDAECRLQSERECLSTLEELAGAAPRHANFERDFFAVLVNGDTSELHNGNIDRAYRVLRTLGVADEHIFILSNNDPRPQLRRQEPPLVTAQATRKSLANVLYFLRGEVDDNDCVLLYTTGHGVREKGQSALCLNDGLTSSSELAQQLSGIDSAVTTVVMDQCFSGGFADTLEKAPGNIVAMTNTDGFHDTYCEYFAAAFWMSLLEPETDLDSDGRVSFMESYEVAMTIHRLALSDTPERTQGRFVALHDETSPGVAVKERCLRWNIQGETEDRNRTRVAVRDSERQERIQVAVRDAEDDPAPFRRSHGLSGHRFGYRP